MTLAHQERAERYVEAAVNAEIEALASTTSGRNAALNKAAFALGGFVAAGALSEDEAFQRLAAACETNGYVRKDGLSAVRSSIRSGIRAGLKEPRQLPRENTITRSVPRAAQAAGCGLTLAQYAEDKRLPIDALQFFGLRDALRFGRPCVEILYARRDGTPGRTRQRCAIGTSEDHSWRVDEKERLIVAYEPDQGELVRVQQELVILEGESDVLTLLFAGIAALGVPGADFAKVIEAHHLDGVQRVFVACELNEVGDPDSGAERFVPNVRNRLTKLGFAGSVYELRMPEGAKDANDLWKLDQAAFPARVRAAMASVSTPPRPAYLLLDEMIMRALRPLGHRLETGLKTLDEATRGGIPIGRLIVFAGAPGATKTGLSLYLCHQWERAGCAAVYLAADEPAEGILTRLGQLAGWSRESLEGEGDIGDSVRAGFARSSKDRSLVVIDPDADESMATIEDAEKALLHLAGDRPRVLVVDSLQTVRCSAADAAESARERIDAKLRVLKAIAKRGTLVVAISEMARSGYRTGDRATDVSALAAGKESGSIEYGAALLLGLRSVKGEAGLIDVEVAKNRLGGSKPEFRVQLDFDRASFVEVERPADENSDAVSAKRVRFEKLRAAIFAAVRSQRLTSANAVFKVVRGTKSEVLAEVKDLLGEGALRVVDGAFRVVDPSQEGAR